MLTERYHWALLQELLLAVNDNDQCTAPLVGCTFCSMTTITCWRTCFAYLVGRLRVLQQLVQANNDTAKSQHTFVFLQIHALGVLHHLS